MQIILRAPTAEHVQVLEQALRDQQRKLRGMAGLVHVTNEERADLKRRVRLLGELLEEFMS